MIVCCAQFHKLNHSYHCFVSQILNTAARGGKWTPDLLLITAYLTPWMLEMVLALPNPLFYLVFWSLSLLPPAGVMSPLQLDLVEGRKSMVDWHFAELVQVNCASAPDCVRLNRLSLHQHGQAFVLFVLYVNRSRVCLWLSFNCLLRFTMLCYCIFFFVFFLATGRRQAPVRRPRVHVGPQAAAAH